MRERPVMRGGCRRRGGRRREARIGGERSFERVDLRVDHREIGMRIAPGRRGLIALVGAYVVELVAMPPLCPPISAS